MEDLEPEAGSKNNTEGEEYPLPGLRETGSKFSSVPTVSSAFSDHFHF